MFDCIVSAKSWSASRYEETWKEWLKMLIQFVKFGKGEYPQEVIPEFFNPACNVVEKFSDFVIQIVSCLLLLYCLLVAEKCTVTCTLKENTYY